MVTLGIGVLQAQVGTTCPACYGTGHLGACSLCGGRGAVSTMYGTSVCYNCMGTGRSICSNCGGRGYIVSQQSTPNPDSSDRYGYNTCHICKGTGVCPSCSGNGYFSNPYTTGYVNCPHCVRDSRGNNTGKCSTCKGTGKVYGIK